MKVSKEVSAQHRDDLLRAAARLFREKGFDKVGIAEIAAEAGLTHGAFYTHFASKEALFAEAIERSARASGKLLSNAGDWPSYVEAYLSMRHVRDRGHGCPFAALGGDVPRESPAIREAYRAALERAITGLAEFIDDAGEAEARERAIQALASLIGGLVLARAADDPARGQEILAAVRAGMLGDTGP